MKRGAKRRRRRESARPKTGKRGGCRAGRRPRNVVTGVGEGPSATEVATNDTKRNAVLRRALLPSRQQQRQQLLRRPRRLGVLAAAARPGGFATSGWRRLLEPVALEL